MLECLKGKFPMYWQIQVQHQLLVTGLDEATIFVWCAEGASCELVVRRDPVKMRSIIDSCSKFYFENLLPQIPPEDKYVTRSDEKWEELVIQYASIKRHRIAMEATEKVLSEQIIALCDDKPSKGLGIRVERNTVKGNVDYSTIPELQGVDLDQFRKPSSVRWRICDSKD
jgi:predicted phage-related endonuclease